MGIDIVTGLAILNDVVDPLTTFIARIDPVVFGADEAGDVAWAYSGFDLASRSTCQVCIGPVNREELATVTVWVGGIPFPCRFRLATENRLALAAEAMGPNVLCTS